MQEVEAERSNTIKGTDQKERNQETSSKKEAESIKIEEVRQTNSRRFESWPRLYDQQPENYVTDLISRVQSSLLLPVPENEFLFENRPSQKIMDLVNRARCNLDK